MKMLNRQDENQIEKPVATETEILVELEQCRHALRLAHAEIEQRNRNTITLTTFAYRASRVEDLDTLLKLALQQSLEMVGTSIGAVVLVDTKTGVLTLGYHEGLTPELAHILTGQDLGHGAVALMPHLVAGTGALLEYQTTDDLAERKLLKAGRVSSLASFPLIVNQHVLGAVVVCLQGKKSFKSSESSFLMAISQTTALAIETFRTREKMWWVAETFLDEERENRLKIGLRPSESLPLAEVEDEIQQENMDLQVLMALAQMVNQSLNLSEILQCAVDQTKAILNTDAAWLYMVEEQEQLKMYAHAGLSKNYVQGMRRLTYDDEMEGEVARTNKPCFVASIINRSHKIWVDKEGLRALAAVPITRRYTNQDASAPSWHVMGVLATGIRGNQAYEWSLHEMDLLIAIANQVGSAVEKAQWFADVQQSQTSLKGSNEILREINDMLIQKNATFERFIHQELKPAIAKTNQSLKQIDPTGLNTTQKQHFMTIQKIMDGITTSSQRALDG
jgi:GAF domain-containing protein